MNSKLKISQLRQNDEYLLIILDACRYDYMEKHWQDWFTGEISKITSSGMNTFEYVSNCWRKKDGKYDITYVSGAVPVNSSIDKENRSRHFERLTNGYIPKNNINNIVDVWDFGWDNSIGICPPEPVTNTALNINDSKIVAHYFQPHAPYIGEEKELGHTGDVKHARPNTGKPVDEPIWQRVQRDEISDDRLRELYESNLLRVLPEAAKLVHKSNINNIVVTADHGESLGENNEYGHKSLTNPAVNTVPWIEVDSITEEAKDSIREEKAEFDIEDKDGEVISRLESLGYI